jgi:TBC1 domain family member 5
VLDPSSFSADDDGDDPLNDSSTTWAALRADEALRAEIALDVERCMPELAYFRDPDVQRCLGDALFVWCRINGDVGYRQGMHEVLGMVLWVVERDALTKGSEEGKAKVEGVAEESVVVVQELLDRRFVEHDVFSLFARIMQTAKSFYEPAAANPQGGQHGEEQDSPMIVRAKHIFYDLLPMIDADLATHLQNIDVIPQIFLMRWVRLLFGREFPFQDVLDMWDLLFSSGPSLELVDYVCIAMILRIRWERKYYSYFIQLIHKSNRNLVLESDTNTALTLLLRYPPLSSSSKPISLLFDARELHASPSAETGSSTIHSRTSRRPSTIDRPLTPNRRSRSPFAYSASSPANLEALLSDAARGVLSRSERWGLNQAVRDVVGEVRRGVQRGIAGSTSGSTSPAPGPRYRRHGSQSKSKSETHSAIAASAFRRINELEERNRKLAIMMEGAVTDLWSVHERLVEKIDGSDIDQRKKDTDAMSAAVARLQFVHAFLKDLTLPLPEEPVKQNSVTEVSEDATIKTAEAVPGLVQEKQQEVNRATQSSGKPPVQTFKPPRKLSLLLPSDPPKQSQSPPSNQSISASPKTKAPVTEAPLPAPQPKRSSASRLTHEDPPSPPAAPPVSITVVPPAAPPSPTPAPKPRPRLTESSFSWMLTGDATGDSFSRATPFTPHEKRSQVASTSNNASSKSKTGKGFLFGEDSDGEITELNDREGSESKAKPKGRGRVDGRRGSLEKLDEVDLGNA